MAQGLTVTKVLVAVAIVLIVALWAVSAGSDHSVTSQPADKGRKGVRGRPAVHGRTESNECEKFWRTTKGNCGSSSSSESDPGSSDTSRSSRSWSGTSQSSDSSSDVDVTNVINSSSDESSSTSSSSDDHDTDTDLSSTSDESSSTDSSGAGPSRNPNTMDSTSDLPVPVCEDETTRKRICWDLGGYGQFNNLLISTIHLIYAAKVTDRTLYIRPGDKELNGNGLDNILVGSELKRAYPCIRFASREEYAKACSKSRTVGRMRDLESAKEPAVKLAPSATFKSRDPTVDVMKSVYHHIKFVPRIMDKVNNFIDTEIGTRDYGAVHLRRLGQSRSKCEERAKRFSTNLVGGTASSRQKSAMTMCSPNLKLAQSMMKADRAAAGVGEPPQDIIFVASDHMVADLDAEYSRYPGSRRFKGKCDHTDCMLIDFALLVHGRTFVGNPLSTLAVNVARIRATLPFPLESHLVHDPSNQVRLPIWYGYKPNGGDPNVNLLKP